MKTYQHTQPGTVVIWIIGAVAAILILGSIFYRPLLISVGFLLVAAWMFRSLTIEISDTELAWHFGSGWPRKSAPLKEISSAEPIRTTFMHGWGIHYTPRGWLYNVSGYGAVAVRLRYGKQFCLGTDEPEKLAEEISRRSNTDGQG